MANAAVKLEREKRRSRREEALFDLLKRPEVLAPLMGLGTFGACVLLGKSRMVNRDAAGFMSGIGPVIAAGSVGVNDKYALLGIYGAATVAYALAVPAREGEPTTVTVDLSKLYGGDGKLFGLTMPTWLGGGEGT
jgi:hypothetical protein